MKRATPSPLGAIGIVLIVAIIACAIFAPSLSPYDPLSQNVAKRLKAPSKEHLLGTDHFGRDILSRMLWGARSSLIIGVLSVVVGATAGLLIGMYVGYVGGWLNSATMRIVDAMMAFPSLILALLIITALGSSMWAVIIAIGVTMVPKFARLSEGQTVSVKERDFVHAARAVGANKTLIIARHVLPNIVGPVVVLTSLNIAIGIRIEASLGFLGYGLQPPNPTWGNIIKDGLRFIQYAPWVSTIPGIAIILTVLGFNLVGDALQDYLDPQVRKEKAGKG